MGLKGVLLVGTSIAYMSTHKQQRGAALLALRLPQSSVHVVRVVAIRHCTGMPPIRIKPLADVFSESKIRCASKRDVVLIVEVDQLAQAKMPGERCRFRRHPFHQVTIRDKRVGVVIHQGVPRTVISSSQPRLGDGHAHAIAKPLAERTRRNFNARCMVAPLGMARRLAAPLAKAFNLIQ